MSFGIYAFGSATFGGAGNVASAVVVEPVPKVTSVQITPAGAIIPGGTSFQFSAQAFGDNNPPQEFDWYVDIGSVDATGRVTVPVAALVAQPGVLIARSRLNPDISDSAEFTVQALEIKDPLPTATVTGIQITPVTAFVEGGGTAQFYAEVIGDNDPSQDVTWRTTLGSVDDYGLLTVPAATPAIQQGILTATSLEDPEISASINFNILPLAESFTPSVARTVRILPGRQAFAVGSHWTLGSAGPVGQKDPNSTIDIPFDWSAWLADIGGAQLAKVEFFLSGGLQEEGALPGPAGGTVLVSGGTPKGTATITCRITTATTPARIDDRTVVLQIGEQ